VNLTTPLQLAPALRMIGALPQLPYTPSLSGYRQICLRSKRSRSYTTNIIAKFAIIFKHQILNFFPLSDQT
jgi:hypothetical protein